MQVHYRKEIRELSEQEYSDYCKAVRGIQQIDCNKSTNPKTYKNSFGYLASIHGSYFLQSWPLPDRFGSVGMFCAHDHNVRFPLWHRQYMLAYENALRTIVPTTSLHYWDISKDKDNNLTDRVTQATVMIDGHSYPNPLLNYTAPYESVLNKTAYLHAHYTTIRNTDERSDRAQYAQAYVDAYNGTTNYATFGQTLESAHDSVHVYVGGSTGDMSSLARAGFDPIFFLHHSNVERWFYLWQKKTSAHVPASNKKIGYPFHQLLSDQANWAAAFESYDGSPNVVNMHADTSLAHLPNAVAKKSHVVSMPKINLHPLRVSLLNAQGDVIGKALVPVSPQENDCPKCTKTLNLITIFHHGDVASVAVTESK